MNGRRSFDRNRSNKPVNINIYYNINSRNITNNHQAVQYPVSARIPKLSQNNSFSQKQTLKSKPKHPTKLKKKKHSLNLGLALGKKIEKIGAKSNNVSLCSSNFLAKKSTPRISMDNKQRKNTQNIEKQKKLSKILQNFTGGELNRQALTKEILNIFEREKVREEDHIKNKKKPSQSTLLGNSTPRHQQHQGKLMRLNSATTTQNVKFVNNLKTRKKQSKSEQCSYSNSKTMLSKNKFVENIVEIKGIDSSLFLADKEDEGFCMIDRINQVFTSQSVMILKEHIEQERKLLPFHNSALTHEQKMAIRIQRAWRKYKTYKIIGDIFKEKKLQTIEASQITQHVALPSQEGIGLQIQNFLSYEIGGKNTIGEGERKKGQMLRKHELEKWNQIMQYVQVNMKNKQLSSDECLSRIIEYFQNVKKTVENQINIGIKNQSIKMKQSRQITQFTNKVESKEIEMVNKIKRMKSAEEQDQRSDFDEVRDQNWQQSDDSGKQSQLLKGIQQNDRQVQDFMDNYESDKQSDLLEFVQEQQNQDESKASHMPQNLFKINKSLDSNHHYQLNKILCDSQNIDFETIIQALETYSKKLSLQHEQELDKLNINSSRYMEIKRKVDHKFNSSKIQLKRIIRNLNKGYEQARQILQKSIVIVSDEGTSVNNNSRSTLSKCKSDNYLLKTAINYKKFVEKKQKEKVLKKQTVKSLLNCSSEEQNADDQKLDDLNPATSLQLTQCLNFNEINQQMIVKLQRNIQAKNSVSSCNKFEENIISAQFLQYQDTTNKVQQQDHKAQIDEFSLKQNSRVNEQNNKFKKLSNQEKEDIFQFIFIDLTLELMTEYEGSRIQKFVKKYIEKRKVLDALPKGVKTGIPACKEYLRKVEEFVFKQFDTVFYQHVSVPIGPTASEMLRYMREEDLSQDDQGNNQKQDDEISVPIILPVPIFETLEKQLMPNCPKYYEDEAKQKSRIRFLKSLDHIHHKAIFDSLNQCLDAERPFGIWGKPFPWKTSFKVNHSYLQQSQESKRKKMSKSSEKVIECCSYLCGILIDKEQSIFGNHKVSEQYFQQIRQDRMSKMLSNDLYENQERWHFYDDEFTEVLMEFSKYFTNVLITEITMEIYQIGKKYSSNFLAFSEQKK